MFFILFPDVFETLIKICSFIVDEQDVLIFHRRRARKRARHKRESTTYLNETFQLEHTKP